jgi:acyl-CoA synthetase (AMP-forming)/AMP-acid ligase II
MAGNISEPLRRIARERPNQVAVYQPALERGAYRVINFHDLWRRINAVAAGLELFGITPGTRAVVMIPPSIEFVEFTFALFRLGAAPVFIDPGMGMKNIRACVEQVEPEAFIGVRKAHWARKLFGWGRRSIRKTVLVGGWGRNSDAALRRLGLPRTYPKLDQPAQTSENEMAAILFTSGSTGVPKGAVYTHGMFLAQLKMLKDTFRIEPGEVDLCTFPLFALFGPALGMTSVVPDMNPTRPADVDPRNIVRPAHDFAATNLFGSPALLARVSQAALAVARRLHDRDAAPEFVNDVVRMPTLKRVLSAGAPVAPRILAQFQSLLSEGASIYTPYGATEALPVAVISSREVLEETCQKTAEGAGTCVGKPVDGIDVQIIRISDDPIEQWSDDLALPRGEIGEICVRGPNVTQEYFRRPDLTALAKIPDPLRGGKWHRMGDVGYFDQKGRLWFCGRKSQRVVTPANTYYTDPVEGIFNTHPDVFRSALVGVTRNGAVKPVLCVELNQSKNFRTPGQIAKELLDLGAKFPLTREITTILFHNNFPVDTRHNSKIFREKLAVWAARKLR